MMRKFSEQYAKRYARHMPQERNVPHSLPWICQLTPLSVPPAQLTKCLLIRRTGTYFCMDLSVTAVVIKVHADSHHLIVPLSLSLSLSRPSAPDLPVDLSTQCSTVPGCLP